MTPHPFTGLKGVMAALKVPRCPIRRTVANRSGAAASAIGRAPIRGKTSRSSSRPIRSAQPAVPLGECFRIILAMLIIGVASDRRMA